ncbi:MAG: ABC transporter permease [Deinococcales bacterium]
MTAYRRGSLALTRRWLWHLRREPAGLIASLAQPALWLLLFGNLFAKSQIVQGHSYIAFMTAGVVVMTAFNGALNGGVELLFDRESELLRRLLAAPLPPSAILTSRLVYVLGISTVQSFVILLVALLMGVRVAAGAPGALLVLAYGVLLGLGVCSLSMALAFALHGHAQFFALVGFLGLPLLFASNALAPLDAMPGWLQFVAHVNPMTFAITASRSLILDGLQPGLLLTTLVFIAVFDTLGIAACLRALRWVTT